MKAKVVSFGVPGRLEIDVMRRQQEHLCSNTRRYCNTLAYYSYYNNQILRIQSTNGSV